MYNSFGHFAKRKVSRGRRNMLTDEETELLIELWQGQENLYNVNMNEYFDRTLAKESHIFISQELNKPEWTGEYRRTDLPPARDTAFQCRAEFRSSLTLCDRMSG